MDPNFFSVDLERAFEVFVAIVILSMILERSLSLIFEHRWYVNNFDDKGYKTVIAFGAAFYLCQHWQFDALSIIVLQDQNQFAGYLLTAGVIAGGSKASLALFHDFLGVQSTALREKKGREQKEQHPDAATDPDEEGEES